MKIKAALLLAGGLTFFGGAVRAQDLNDDCPDSPATCEIAVTSTSLTPEPSAPAVIPQAAAPAAQTQLPVTGGEAVSLALVGGGLVLGGAVLLRSRKLVAVKAD